MLDRVQKLQQTIVSGAVFSALAVVSFASAFVQFRGGAYFAVSSIALFQSAIWFVLSSMVHDKSELENFIWRDVLAFRFAINSIMRRILPKIENGENSWEEEFSFEDEAYGGLDFWKEMRAKVNEDVERALVDNGSFDQKITFFSFSFGVVSMLVGIGVEIGLGFLISKLFI